jgi:hypothetical protein
MARPTPGAWTRPERDPKARIKKRAMETTEPMPMLTGAAALQAEVRARIERPGRARRHAAGADRRRTRPVA